MAVLPDGYVDNIVNHINSIPDCATLQTVEQRAIAELSTMIDNFAASATDRASKNIAPLSATSNITNVISTLNNIITLINNFLNSGLSMYYDNLNNIIEVMTAINTIKSAVETKYTGMSCSFTQTPVPSYPSLDVPPVTVSVTADPAPTPPTYPPA